jgi:hypothetical protein
MTSSPLKNGNCIEAGLLCSGLRHLSEIRGGFNSGSKRFGWRCAFSCGATQSQHLPKKASVVVADENITSNGIDFVRWYRRFRSPASIPMLKDNESSTSTHHSVECVANAADVAAALFIRCKNRPPICDAERLLVD